MPTRDDVSRVDQSGCMRSSRLIDGTPEKFVILSRSMSSRARPGSHLYVITTFPPTSVAGCNKQLHAVTWNSGVGAINAGEYATAGAGAAVTSPRATAFCSAAVVMAPIAAMLKMLATEPR